MAVPVQHVSPCASDLLPMPSKLNECFGLLDQAINRTVPIRHKTDQKGDAYRYKYIPYS